VGKRIVVTVAVGPHPSAEEFVGELLGEISWLIDSTEIEGVPVTYGVVREEGHEDAY
jgi:hypothetical protein